MNKNWLDRIKVKPRDYQFDSVMGLSQHESCLLQSPTGSGKSNVAIYLTTYLAKKTIMVFPKTDLIKQTYNRFLSCTDIDPKHIVQYNGRSNKVGPITLITWQSLAAALKNPKKWGVFENYFDVVICDEAHKSGVSHLLYTMGVDRLNCKYKYGLSATPFRSNGETKALTRFFDDNIIDIPIDLMYSTKALIKPHIELVYTDFKYDVNECLKEWQKMTFGAEQKLGIMKKVMGEDGKRNRTIISHVNRTKAKCNLVLSFTTLQTDILHSMDNSVNKLKIYGKMGKAEKADIMYKINDMESVTIYATQSFLGEGTDIPKLQNLYITTPFAGGAKAVQFAGRVLRPYPGKDKVTVYDYCDQINYDPYNNKKVVDYHSWTKKRIKEYERLKPFFLKKNILDY